MSKTLIGIVSYGGLPFLELALRSIEETTNKVDVVVIVAKPGDEQMWEALKGYPKGFFRAARRHEQNMGFPASVNDLYDAAFTDRAFPKYVSYPADSPNGVPEPLYDHLIIMGNDVVALPGSIDAMIHTAETTDFEMVCGSEFDSRFLVNTYPEARQFFHGDNLVFNDFTARPWELHTERRSGIEPHARKDIRNFTLFKRSAFEKVGYADVAYWPNGYFEDNSYCERCDHLGVSACGLLDAPFFHFWSRTIHQGENRQHGKWFGLNKERYDEWKANPVWKIESRDGEAELIKKWGSR